MKICELEIENFLVIGKANINLKDRGLMLVQGVNDADSSATSNGAGKSSIADAISWCLYGVTARGVAGDDVVNDQVKKGTRVSLSIEDGDDLYTIQRYRKHKEFKNDLYVFKQTKSGEIEITKGTTQATQEMINKIMGCSVEVFNAAVYAGQEQMPNLPGMTDKQLKAIIEEAAGTDRLERALQEANARHKTMRLRLDNLHYALADLRDTKSSKESWAIAKIKEMEEAREKFEGAKKIEIELLEKKVKEKISELMDVRSGTPELSLTSLNKDLERYKSAIEEMKKELSEIHDTESVIREEILTADFAVKSLEADISSNKELLNKVRKEIDNAQSIVGTKCAECGKDYREDDIVEFVASKKAEMRRVVLLLKDKLLGDLENAKKTLTEALEKRKDTKPIIDSITELTAQKEAVMLKIKDCELVLEKERNLKAEIRELDARIEDKKASEFSFFFSEEEVRAEIIDIEEKISSIVAEIDDRGAELDLIEGAQVVFGRAGIRAHILDNVTPFLNERTAEYLSALTDGNIHATWTTLSATSKGELREKFSIEVHKVNGAKSFKGLSGGEKRKVRISTAMALRDFVATRASKPIMFQFFDEIDDAVDEAGLERLMGILVKKGREMGTVLVISHNDLNSYISDSIVIRNKGGISTID